MTNISDAAKATRKYFVTWHGPLAAKVWQAFVAETGEAASPGFSSEAEAQAACDKLNAEAFLRAIRAPSEEMVANSADFPWVQDPMIDDTKEPAKDIWRAMIDALIAEIDAASE